VRILCDQNVGGQYIEAFHQTEWITVARLDEVLSIETIDTEIARYATQFDWVVFTSDKRFLVPDTPADIDAMNQTEIDCGVIYYDQRQSPAPGTVIDALQAIAETYSNHSEINEYVLGGWV
jgi:predicted nuclease of predicted toxin-antitoxin system